MPAENLSLQKAHDIARKFNAKRLPKPPTQNKIKLLLLVGLKTTTTAVFLKEGYIKLTQTAFIKNLSKMTFYYYFIKNTVNNKTKQ